MTPSYTEKLFNDFRVFLGSSLSSDPDSGLISCIAFIAVLICAVAGYYITIAFLKLVAMVVEKTETDWDDDLINAPILRAISQLAPALIIDHLLPYCFNSTRSMVTVLNIATDFYIIWVTIYIINTFLDNLFTAFSKRKKFRPFAVKGIFQMGKLIFIGIGIIIAISILVGKTPVAILTTLGASAAILMLVFKDTIMGLVASVQLTANKMVQRGDWIVVPKHNANGEVVEISLTTVKIRNWDNSITTVPPYSLVSDSFQNFQAMRRSGARRVCRTVNIDINSVRRLTPDEIASLQNKGLYRPDPETSASAGPDAAINITLFREYLESWLEAHQDVRSDLLYMVRQMEQTPQGLPVEIYFFLSVTQWKEFEHLQSRVFDHIYAVIPLFHLTTFQVPSGRNILALTD